MPPLDPVSTTIAVPAGHERAAQRVHLVHVTHRLGRLALDEVWEMPGLPDSKKENNYCGDTTRFVEAKCDFPPSIYFYAGRALPDYGNVALAFSPECETSRSTSATPFDTGAVVKSDPNEWLKINLSPDDLNARIDFCKRSNVGQDWRTRFGHWLAYYFQGKTSDSYWSERPIPDPERLYSLNSLDQWQAWTWEIRFEGPFGPHPCGAAFWSSHLDTKEKFRQELTKSMLSPREIDRRASFFAKWRAPFDGADFCAQIEMDVKNSCH